MTMIYTLQHAPADVVRWLAIQMGLGTSPNDLDPTTHMPNGLWPVYWNNEPDPTVAQPDELIVVYDTTGQDDGRTMPDGEAVAHHGFQVRVRGAKAATVRRKLDAIRDAFSRSVYNDVVIVPATNADSTTATYRVACIVRIKTIPDITKNAPKTKRSIGTLNALVSLRQLS